MKNILPILLIGIAVGGFFMFTRPTYDELTGVKEKVASYSQALENARAIDAERDKLTKKQNSFDPVSLEKLNKLLPDGVDNIRLILEIEEIAKPYGMSLRDIKYSAAPKTDAEKSQEAGVPTSGTEKLYGVWDLGFSTQGTYSNFIAFVEELEKNLRIVDITSVDFSSDTGPGLNPNTQEAYKYSIKIKTYWLKN